MLTLCIKFSVVPDSFANGLLTLILKKPGCDASNPKNWRPIVVLSTLSKFLEMYVLDMSSQHECSDLQFGFIPGRGTELATVLIDDVMTYCSTIKCSLDAEGAFDAIRRYHIVYYLRRPHLPSLITAGACCITGTADYQYKSNGTTNSAQRSECQSEHGKVVYRPLSYSICYTRPHTIVI